MSQIESWARAVLIAVVGGACALSSGGRELPVAPPPPRAKPTDADWLPKPDPDAWVEGAIVNGERQRWKVEGLAPDPPTAFPDLVPPPYVREPPQPERPHRNAEAFAKLCPRLHGTIALTIEQTDDTLRKLLKARLHQGVLEFRQHQKDVGPRRSDAPYHACLENLRSTAVELWAGQPKDLIPWLEELVIAGKHLERYTRTRAYIGMVWLSELHAASRLRLKFEAELWKAKNPK